MCHHLKKHRKCFEGICSTGARAFQSPQNMEGFSKEQLKDLQTYQLQKKGPREVSSLWMYMREWRERRHREFLHQEQQICWVVSWLQHQENRLISKAISGGYEMDYWSLISTNLAKPSPALPKSVLAPISNTFTACPWPTDTACSASPAPHTPHFRCCRVSRAATPTCFHCLGWGVNRVLAHTAATPAPSPAQSLLCLCQPHTTATPHGTGTLGGQSGANPPIFLGQQI